MAQFTPTDAVTEATHWAAGSYFRFDYFRDEFGQSLEFQRQSHKHAGAPGDGAFIPAADPKYIVMYSVIWGGGPLP